MCVCSNGCQSCSWSAEQGKINISLSAFAPENLVWRDGFGNPVPRRPAHLHTQAEPGTYFRNSSRFPRRRPFIYFKPPYVIGSVPSLSGHAIAYRWRSPPRVRRHRASKPQGSSERVLPWPNLSSETRFSGANGDREKYIFSVKLTTRKIGKQTG